MSEVITTEELKERQKQIRKLGMDLPMTAHKTLNRLNNLIYATQNDLEELVHSRDKLVSGINRYLT